MTAVRVDEHLILKVKHILTDECWDESLCRRLCLAVCRVWREQSFHISYLIFQIIYLFRVLLLVWYYYFDHIHDFLQRRRATCHGLIYRRLCVCFNRQTNHSQHESKAARLGHVDYTDVHSTDRVSSLALLPYTCSLYRIQSYSTNDMHDFSAKQATTSIL